MHLKKMLLFWPWMFASPVILLLTPQIIFFYCVYFTNSLIRNNLTLFLTFYRLHDKWIDHQMYGMRNDYIWPIFSL